MIPKKVISHLEKHEVPHEVVTHKPVYTTFDLASTLKEKLNKIGKTLLVKAGGKRYVIIVLPAHLQVNLNKLKKILKVNQVVLATEKEMQKLLKVKPGALLPFGSLHKLETFIDKGLLKVKDVLIGAGSFTESLRMKSKDLSLIEDATVADFSEAAKKVAKKIVKKAKKVVKSVTKTKKVAKKTTKK